MSKPLFPLGRCLITPGAKETLESLGVMPAALLQRHESGDWSELCREDQAANREAVSEGFRVFSTYHLAADSTVPIWVITEADRSCTTILLPEEY